MNYFWSTSWFNDRSISIPLGGHLFQTSKKGVTEIHPGPKEGHKLAELPGMEYLPN